MGLPLISAMPQFGKESVPQDDLVTASPIYQTLLGMTGGQAGQNADMTAASNTQFGQALSFLQPGGGLNPQQAGQFGPLVALMLSLQGGGMTPGGTS